MTAAEVVALYQALREYPWKRTDEQIALIDKAAEEWLNRHIVEAPK